MSELAMLNAQVEQLTHANNSLAENIRNQGCQLRAQKQCIDEYLGSNINLRAHGILLEDSLNILKNDLSMMKERCLALENSNANLNAQIVELQKPAEESV